jgi:hypothetical protein
MLFCRIRLLSYNLQEPEKYGCSMFNIKLVLIKQDVKNKLLRFLCYVFMFCISSACFLCPMLPVSLGCPLLIAHLVFPNVYLNENNHMFSWQHAQESLYLMEEQWWWSLRDNINNYFMKISTM